MSDSRDETTIDGWKPNAHPEDALQQVRKDSRGVERMAVAIEDELERRGALFGEARRATPER